MARAEAWRLRASHACGFEYAETMKLTNTRRREFMKSAAGLGAAGALPLMAAAAEGGPRTKAPGGIRPGVT